MSALQTEQSDPDALLLDRLRAGDERAFVSLARQYRPSMLRIASGYVPNAAVAEEVVQDAWVGFLHGLSRFEGRSSVRTWLFRILVNRARTTGVKESRSLAVSNLPAMVDAARFDATGHGVLPPQHWADSADDRIVAERMAAAARTAMVDLPARQREVVTLRDVKG